MTVDEWVFGAIEACEVTGATLLEVQGYVDEYLNEELALNTIEDSLAKLVREGRLARKGDHWCLALRTSKDDALKKLFGSG